MSAKPLEKGEVRYVGWRPDLEAGIYAVRPHWTPPEQVAELIRDAIAVLPSSSMADPDPVNRARVAKVRAAAPALLDVLRALVDSPNAKANALWDRARAAVAECAKL